MLLRTHPYKNPSQTTGAPGRKLSWARTLASLAAVTCVAITCHPSSEAAGQTNPPKSVLIAPVGRVPDANAQMTMRDQQAKKQNYDAANLERKRQLTDDSARLLKLASDLKAEVDKTSKDTLSLAVIRKADEIERLAHSVKEKMKLTVGGN
jgi:hypothetical protein